MDLFNVMALLLVLSALFSYANYKVLRLPKTVGLMIISLVMSAGILGLDHLGFGFREQIAKFVGSIDFGDAVLKVALCFMLFAGSLHVDFRGFWERKWPIASLATLGVIISTTVIGFLMYLALPYVGLPMPLSICLLFGALISPTDPIAVLALLKSADVPKSVETKVVGEALLNDGFGVVVFAVILDIFYHGEQITALNVGKLLLREAGGGIALGLACGWAAFQLIRRVDDYHVEILLSLALVTGGYSLASVLHVSGPLAMVAAGLFIGTYGRAHGMSEKSRINLDLFWEVLDDVLNVLLFVLVGLEALLLNLKFGYFVAAGIAIPIVLLGRFISVSVSLGVTGLTTEFSHGARTILTWGGLRGGVSFALALALPHVPDKEAVLVITYCVVVFSVLVQGLTMRPLLRFLARRAPPPSPPS